MSSKKKGLAVFDSLFLPIISAQEMSRLEKLAIQQGSSEEAFMAEAGKRVAAFALERIGKGKRATLLVGKGNNGGDAWVAGLQLLEEGVKVRAIALYPPDACSPLNRKFNEAFRRKRGQIEYFEEAGQVSFDDDAVILDGLLGTGFKGKVEPKMGALIHLANESRVPIIAIDIPSGLDGTTGTVGGIAIKASATVALGMPKSGFILRQGWNHVGRVHIENFGLAEKFFSHAKATALFPKCAQLARLLPKIERNRHKYQAGYVVGLSGSKIYRGAPKLAGMGALRAGAGIVRVFSFDDIGETPHELIAEMWSEKRWNEELKRAGAVFIGPGMGSSIPKLKIKVPSVWDADAIQSKMNYPSGSILTPHRGEALRLFGLKTDTMEEDLFARCQKFVNTTECILVLKGAPTYIFSAKKPPVVIPHGDPGMATAGAGDVLTGVLASLLAQKMAPFEAAVLGAALHALAGEAAAKEKTSYGLIAGDLIAHLPNAFLQIEQIHQPPSPL